MHELQSEPEIVIRPPIAGQWGRLFVTIIMGAVVVFMFAAFFAVINDERFTNDAVFLGAFLLGLAGFLIGLFDYMLRDLRGHWNWRADIFSDGVKLRLPSGRSLVHSLRRVDRFLLFEDIDCIELRLEAYPMLWMVNMHRAFALRLKDGGLIILGEDRALATKLSSSLMGDLAKAIFQNSDLPVRDLGMAEGRSGFMFLAFQSPPPWDAPALEPERQEVLWRAARLTGEIATASAYTLLIR